MATAATAGRCNTTALLCVSVCDDRLAERCMERMRACVHLTRHRALRWHHVHMAQAAGCPCTAQRPRDSDWPNGLHTAATTLTATPHSPQPVAISPPKPPKPRNHRKTLTATDPSRCSTTRRSSAVILTHTSMSSVVSVGKECDIWRPLRGLRATKALPESQPRQPALHCRSQQHGLRGRTPHLSVTLTPRHTHAERAPCRGAGPPCRR